MLSLCFLYIIIIYPGEDQGDKNWCLFIEHSLDFKRVLPKCPCLYRNPAIPIFPKKHSIIVAWGFRSNSLSFYDCSLKLLLTLTTEACSPINWDSFLIGPAFHWELRCDHQLILLKSSGQNWQAVKGKHFLHFSSIVQVSNYEMSITAVQKAISIQMPWNVLNCLK